MFRLCSLALMLGRLSLLGREFGSCFGFEMFGAGDKQLACIGSEEFLLCSLRTCSEFLGDVGRETREVVLELLEKKSGGKNSFFFIL